MPKLNYQLRKEAEFDLEDIFDYSEDNFGLDIAVKYLNDLESIFSIYANILISEKIDLKLNLMCIVSCTKSI